MAFDEVIFEGKTLSDMFSDVYKNTNTKREQINSFVASFVKMIRTPEDAAVMGPVIKDFLDLNKCKIINLKSKVLNICLTFSFSFNFK